MDFSALTMAELKNLYDSTWEAVTKAKKEHDIVGAEIERRVKPLVNGFGTVHRNIDGVHMKLVMPKKVDWDQDTLKYISEQIKEAGQNPETYLKISYGVSETTYENWPEEIKETFAPARTEKTGKLQIEFEEGE